jgi:hypothetical protein
MMIHRMVVVMRSGWRERKACETVFSLVLFKLTMYYARSNYVVIKRTRSASNLGAWDGTMTNHENDDIISLNSPLSYT